MESSRKVRVATNYYRKITLKKYFLIWKKYAYHKLYFTNKLINIPHSYFDLEV